MPDKVEKVNFGEIGPPPNSMPCKEATVQKVLGGKTCSNLLFQIVLHVFARSLGEARYHPRPHHHDCHPLYRYQM